MNRAEGYGVISTHSAREDGDNTSEYIIPYSDVFQPTPPARTETSEYMKYVMAHEFQPTPPARTETQVDANALGGTLFQPTPPARTETGYAIRCNIRD